MTCLVTLLDRKLQVFINSPNWPFFGVFNELLATQNVNVARFARNVEWDLFYDFQTLCILWKIIIHRLFVEFNLPVEFSLLLVDEFNLDFTFFNKTANFPHFFSCNLCDHLVKYQAKLSLLLSHRICRQALLHISLFIPKCICRMSWH